MVDYNTVSQNPIVSIGDMANAFSTRSALETERINRRIKEMELKDKEQERADAMSMRNYLLRAAGLPVPGTASGQPAPAKDGITEQNLMATVLPGAPASAVGKPVLQSADGTVSTERTVTVQGPDKMWYNIPTIVNGKQYSPAEAEGLFRQGSVSPVEAGFPTAGEAVTAARARSDAIGKSLSGGGFPAPQDYGELMGQRLLNLRQSEQLKTSLDQAKIFAEIVEKVGGPEEFKKMQPAFEKIVPELAKVDMSAVQFTDDGYVAPIPKRGEDGKPIKDSKSGWSLVVFRDPAGKRHAEIRKDAEGEENKAHGPLDQAAMAKYNKKYIELEPDKQETIDTLVYGKATGPVADAVKQVTMGKKRYWAELTADEKVQAKALIQTQAFQVGFGGESGRGKAQENVPNSFSKWTDEQKDQSYENFIVNGQKPTFAWRDFASRNSWEQGYVQYLIQKGNSAEMVGEKRAYRAAQTKALADNEKYRTAANRFVEVIDKNAELVRSMRKKYGQNYGRLFNSAMNSLRQGVMGDGDLLAMQQVMQSLSNEVAKVESGSMGIAEVSREQALMWKRVHDYNVNADDLDKVLDTSRKLGEIRKSTLRKVTDDLRTELRGKEKAPGTQTSTPKKPVAEMTDEEILKELRGE